MYLHSKRLAYLFFLLLSFAGKSRVEQSYGGSVEEKGGGGGEGVGDFSFVFFFHLFFSEDSVWVNSAKSFCLAMIA